jgi:acyl-CoA reductase-like NAD-dependent aldehyde dehydrogenase
LPVIFFQIISKTSILRGGLFPTINPATNEVIAMVANGTSEDIDLAVQSAVACLHSPTWGYKSTSSQRAAILRKLGDILTERTNELAALDSLDMGKPMREALADLGDAVSCCKHFATLAGFFIQIRGIILTRTCFAFIALCVVWTMATQRRFHTDADAVVMLIMIYFYRRTGGTSK